MTTRNVSTWSSSTECSIWNITDKKITISKDVHYNTYINIFLCCFVILEAFPQIIFLLKWTPNFFCIVVELKLQTLTCLLTNVDSNKKKWRLLFGRIPWACIFYVVQLDTYLLYSMKFFYGVGVHRFHHFSYREKLFSMFLSDLMRWRLRLEILQKDFQKINITGVLRYIINIVSQTTK